MPKIHLHETTTSTPEQIVAGLTDFGPGRQKLFGDRLVGLVADACFPGRTQRPCIAVLLSVVPSGVLG